MPFTGKFVLVFLSRLFSIHRTPEERERYLFNSLYHFHSLHRHLDISRVITVECLPLHVASSQTETGTLIYTYVILIYIYIAYIYIYRHKRKCSYNSWKYAIVRLSEISSLYLYALFRKFCTPLTQSQLRH